MTEAVKRGREPRQDRARLRVAAILDAAVELLREDDVDALTMSRIAARAGSSLPSVYRYFPDRTAVLRALAERYLDELHAGIVDGLAGLRTRSQARRAVRSVLDAYHRAFLEDRALRQLWAGTLADADLVTLNIEDSRRNGALLADRLGPFSQLDDALLLRRCTLASQLALATVSFAVCLDEREGRRYVAEFGSWADVLLLPPDRE